MKRLLRVVRAFYCWCKGGCPVALTADERLDICKKCVHYIQGRCAVCGCILKYKTKMETEKCPIDKW